jgi:truncated hemoglobin YjbI
MMTQQSLYERLGGVNAIAMVVDRFSDQIVKNPKLNVNFALKNGTHRVSCQDSSSCGHMALPSGRRAL